MNKLIIQTQYLENYGSSEEPYMKFKGGSTYVLPNCGDMDSNEIATAVARVKPYITTDLVKSNGGSEEYIVGAHVGDIDEKVCEDWEAITEFTFMGGDDEITFMKVTDNTDMGYMRKEILEKIETWNGCSESVTQRKNYTASFRMEDGSLLNGKQLQEFLELAVA